MTQIESTIPWTTRQPPDSSRCFAVNFQPSLRCQQIFASERVDRLVALDAPELRVDEPLVPEARDEDPLQRSRPPFEYLEAVLVGIIPILFATVGRLDLVASVDDGSENVDEVLAIVADRVPDAGDIVAVAMTLTSDDVGRHIPGADDIRGEDRKIESHAHEVLVQTEL